MKKIFLAFLVVLMPTLVFAADITSGDTVSIEKAQKNPIVFSTTANINSNIEGDLTVFAQNINLNNPVAGSVYIFGQTVNVNAPVGNRLIIGAADAVVKSEIKGDLIIAGGNVTIDNSAKIDGDVFAYGNNVNIKGLIEGNLSTGGSKVVFDSAVIKGNVAVQSSQISLSDNSQISGALKYKSTQEMSLPGAAVKGGISFEQTRPKTSALAYSIVGSMVMLIIAGLLMMWLTGSRLDNLVETSAKKFGSIWVTGLLVAIIAPLVMMLLIISYVGIYSFVILLAFYVLAWLVGYVYGAVLLGKTLVRLISKSKTIKDEWAGVVFGPIVLILLGLIPVIGGLIKFILSVAGVGMFVEQLKGLRAGK